MALGNYSEWRAQNRVFGETGAIEQRSVRLTGGANPRQMLGSVITAGAFRALGVKPALGRPMRDDEDQPGAPKVALPSDGLWRSQSGADAALIGAAVIINEETHHHRSDARGPRFPDTENEPWTSLGWFYPPSEFSNRGGHNYMVVTRLLPGVSRERANQDIRAIAARLERETA